MTYRERRERRAERRQEWAEGRESKAGSAHASAHAITDGIPLGQPILVGHHSEKGHRREIEKAHNAHERGMDHSKMARKHREAASTIEHQLDQSVYRDDHDVVERLETRIAGNEAIRDRRKAINRWIQKDGWRSRSVPFDISNDEAQRAAKTISGCVKAMSLTADEKKEVMAALQFSRYLGYPPYAIAGLSSKIKKDRDRLGPALELAAQRT